MNYIITNSSITCFTQGKIYTVNKEAVTYDLVLAAIRANDEKQLLSILNQKQIVVDKLNDDGSDKVKIINGKLMYEDREITGLIATRVFEMLKQNLDIQPMRKFINNLMQNPSKRSVDELLGFMEACTLPITSDGCFLAYKRVRDDYKDVHSGTFDNSVGKTVEMQRNQVDDNKDQTCSTGLHFCSYNYLSYFGGSRIVVLKINPADVVSIPSDYNNSKGRCCKYEVVDELQVQDRLPLVGITDTYEDKYEVKEELDIKETEVKPVANFSTKLDESKVQSIKNELKAGICVKDIAEAWDISERQVRRIRDGHAWKHVKI